MRTIRKMRRVLTFAFAVTVLLLSMLLSGIVNGVRRISDWSKRQSAVNG